MDAVQRAYAHTAWTAADPLKGLAPEQKRAILLMGPTFRERWRLRPWKQAHAKRLALVDIIAERRLAYDLAYGAMTEEPQPVPTAPTDASLHPGGAPLSPYYRYRLDPHHAAVAQLVDQRQQQDRNDLEANPLARQDRDLRRQTLSAFVGAELLQARQRVDDLERLARTEKPDADLVPPLAVQPDTVATPRRRRSDRDR